MRVRNPAGHVVKGSDGVPLVRHLQGLALDLEVEESNSELGREETISRPHGTGIGSRGDMTGTSHTVGSRPERRWT